ncbi:MAG TPA: RNA methyltransferase [Solirubrobacterales bacterium]|nr:RNA methyltransferase [Solirubrobacterales bacterium]
MTETITSPQNEKLKLIRRLAERRGREREGLFATEGEDLLAAGLASGATPRLVLVAAGSGPGLPQEADPVEVDPELLAGVSALGSGSRVIAAWPLPEPGEPDGAGPCTYLHGVADPGNVGTIVRTSAALGAGQVVLGEGCADPCGPKAVRASMGSIFSHPPRSASISATPSPRLALVAHGGEPLDAALLDLRPATVCFGAEREGLDRESLAACDARATIPLATGAESLNVAAAAAIALYRVCSLAAPPETTA